MLKDFLDEFARYKVIGQKVIDQMSDDSLNQVIGDNNNSIAIKIIRHISGNLVSRFTDFLTSDGEKSWRNRDSEFEERPYNRDEINELWDKGWQVVNSELGQLSDPDLQTQITIRGQAFTVDEALWQISGTRRISYRSDGVAWANNEWRRLEVDNHPEGKIRGI